MQCTCRGGGEGERGGGGGERDIRPLCHHLRDTERQGGGGRGGGVLVPGEEDGQQNNGVGEKMEGGEKKGF